MDKYKKKKDILEVVIVISILICIAVIYSTVNYVNSYTFFTKTAEYQDKLTFINNYNYLECDEIYVCITGVSELTGSSFSLSRETDEEEFYDMLGILFNENREYYECEKDYGTEPSYYVIFSNSETLEELTIYVYQAYNLIFYEDCFFESSEKIDFMVIEEIIKNKYISK